MNKATRRTKIKGTLALLLALTFLTGIGVAVGEPVGYNNDNLGDLDMLVTDGGTYIVDANGNKQSVPTKGYFAGWQYDVDGDGNIEAATPDSDVGYNVFIVDKDGQKDMLSHEADAVGGAGDVDGDGDIDFAFQDRSSGTLKFGDLNNNTIDTGKEIYNPSGLADVDGDGELEAVGRDVNNADALTHVDRNGNTGTYSVNGYGAGGIADYDGDGSKEIPFEDASTNNLKFVDVGGGNVVDTGVELCTANSLGGAADMDADGNKEVAVCLGATYTAGFVDYYGNKVDLGTGASSMGGIADFDNDSAPNYVVDSAVTNSPVDENETLEVNASITNDGTTSGDLEADLILDGEQKASSDPVTIDVGETKQVNITYKTGFDDAGEDITARVSTPHDYLDKNVTINQVYITPLYNITSRSDNSPITENETLQVDGSFSNDGDGSGEMTAELALNGSVKDSFTTTLNENESVSNTFEWSTGFDDNGYYNATLSTQNETQQFDVNVEDIDVATPEEPVFTDPENATTIYYEFGNDFAIDGSGFIDLNQEYEGGLELIGKKYDPLQQDLSGTEIIISPDKVDEFYSTGNKSLSGQWTHNSWVTGGSISESDYERDVELWWRAKNAESETTDSVRTTVKLREVEKPTADNLELTPNITDLEAGDYVDVAVDGSIGTYEFSTLTYSLDVTNNPNPSDIVVTEPDFADSNQYNDEAIDAFEYKSSYNGETVTITATVEDQGGYTASISKSDNTLTEPDYFIQNSPDNGEVFLIPEGDSDYDVTYEWGINTDSNGGTAELVENGNVIDSFSISANSENTQQITRTLTSNDYNWKVRFTDGVTGEVYESNTQSFEVTDEPFSLQLDSPSDGNTFNLLDSNSKDVDHNFSINAEATNKEFYYVFELTNSSSGAVLDSRTSQTLDFGTQSFTETVNSLEGGEYTWDVEIRMSSDDSLQESKNASYTIVESPEYNSELVEPYDGKQIYVDPGQTQTDVNASFTVETFKETVDTEFLYDGSVEDTRTISSQSDETVDLTLTDVPTGTHSVTLNAEDESGRTQSTTHSFEVLEEDEANVTLNELSTEPGLEEITPSDEEFNIYFEAENKTEVEYVDVEVDVNGTTEHTIRVPKDELIIGSVSLLETVDLERDLGYNYNQLVSSDISISATVVDSFQKSYRWSRSFAFGIQDPLPVQQSPTDGKKWKETDGSPEEHRLGYKIEMANEYVDYNVYVNDTLVKSGTAKETGDTFEGEAFVNVVDDLGFNQFGQFNWKVNISEQITGYETSTGTDTFQILNASETDVLLNFNSPEKNDVFTLKNNIDKKTVPFGFNYESEVAGTVKLKLRGDTEATLYNQEVESGSDTETFTEQLPEGEYTATLTYNKEGGETVKEERFFTVRKEENIPEDRVFVDTPSIDERLYQSEQTSFSWGVNSSGGNGDTWYEIRDEDGNLAENYTESYEDYNELSIYGRNIGTLGLGVGDYDAQAFFKRDGDTVQESNNVSFTVVDFDKPELRQINSIENNTVYKEGEPINFSVESKTFDSPATATIKYRHVDDYESFNIAKREYESFETATLEGVKRFEPGQYAWYVQYDVNPTFTTETQYFTVESSDIPEPEFSLNAPEQNQTIEIPSGDNSTNVTFDYDAEVFTSSDSEVNLLLSSREDGLTEFKQRATDIQVEGDGVQNYVKELDLAEDGYLYKVEVVYSNSTHTSDSVGFAVNDPETEETPEPPQPEDGEEQSNFLSQIIEYVAGFLGIGFGGLGGTVQIVLASLLTVLVGGIVNNWTESSEIGLMSMMVSIFIFVATGWLPAWIGIILFMLSAAIFIYALRRVHGGR